MCGVAENTGLSDVYWFTNPRLTHEGNKFDDTQAYMTKFFQWGKEIYFVPYIVG